MLLRTGGFREEEPDFIKVMVIPGSILVEEEVATEQGKKVSRLVTMLKHTSSYTNMQPTNSIYLHTRAVNKWTEPVSVYTHTCAFSKSEGIFYGIFYEFR